MDAFAALFSQIVDSAEFYNNLESMNTYEQGETVGTIAELMMELFLLDGYTSSSCVLCGRNKTINTQNVVKIFLSRYHSQVIKNLCTCTFFVVLNSVFKLFQFFRESSTRTNHKLIVDNELSWRPRSLVQLQQPESPEMQARVPGTDQEASSGRHGLVLHWH